MTQLALDSKSSAPHHSDERDHVAMALEALSKLALQFARRSALPGLFDTLSLTLAGQFAATSIHITTTNPTRIGGEMLRIATGRYRSDEFDVLLTEVDKLLPTTSAGPVPALVEELVRANPSSGFLSHCRQRQVQVIAPLQVDGRLIGLILIGPKFTSAPFSSDDVQLLQALLGALSPLIANTFLYAEMAHLNAWYLGILDNVPQALFVVDDSGSIRKANQAAKSIIGTTVRELAQRDLVGLSVAQVFPQAVFGNWAQRLTEPGSRTSGRGITTVVAHSAGEEHIFSVLIRPVIHPSTNQSEIIVSMQDITEQRNIESRMFDLERFAERGVMASSISHELKNHLGVILGGIELTQVALDRGNQEKAVATLQKLQESVRRMERFTSELMDHSQGHAKKQLTSLNDVLTDVLSFAMVQKRFGRITVQASLDPNLPEVEIDKDQFSQLIINLLNNAGDAIAEASQASGLIVVTTSQDRASVYLTVTDNGCGMPDGVKEKLFHHHLTTKPNGHGYGLVTCSRILRNHDATVEIQSQVGHGTTFAIKLPR